MHLESVKLLWSLLEQSSKRRIKVLSAMMLISGVTELLSVAAVPGFIMAISQAKQILQSRHLENTLHFLNIRTENELVVAAGSALILVFIFRAAFFSSMIWYQSDTISSIAAKMSEKLFKCYLRSPIAKFSTRNTSQYSQIMFIEVQRVTAGYLLPLLAIMMNITVAAALIFLILIVDPFSALGVGAVTAAASYTFMRYSRRRVRLHGDEVSTRSRILSQILGESFDSIKHVRLRGAEEVIFENFWANLTLRRRASRSLFFNGALPKPTFETTAVTSLVLLSFAMIGQGRSLQAIIPTITLIGAIAIRMLPTLNQMTQMMVELNANESAVELMSREFSEYHLTEAPTQFVAEDEHLKGDIILENVNYRYPGQSSDVIHDVSLTIKSGSSVAFVGPTGSGKSTLVDLIIGLLEPRSGKISVDESDISSCLPKWQRQIGYIPQSIFLTDSSIRQNVALGVRRAEIDDQAVWKALRLAQLSDIVEENPRGLDGSVGERGVRISGGQRQRIGIARALYHDPKVLVLDEATAALDNATEAKLMNAINQAAANRTLVMIAHRLTTVKNCDVIYFVKAGRVIASGTYKYLLENCADFKELAQSH